MNVTPADDSSPSAVLATGGTGVSRQCPPMPNRPSRIDSNDPFLGIPFLSETTRMNPNPPESEYSQLVTRNQRKIYWFILSLLPNWSDAEEVLQETNLVLWRKADKYDSSGNFLAWACQIARYEVLKFRERSGRAFPALTDVFDGIGVEAMAAVESQSSEGLLGALADCVEKLRPQDRDLVERRYRSGATTKSVAEEVGRSTDAIYKALQRVHRQLLECVNRSLPM